eukprot:892011_1
MALQLLDLLIDEISMHHTSRNIIIIGIPKKLTKTESELDEHPDKMRLRKGYYHDDRNNIYQLAIVQKVESQLNTQHQINRDVAGDIHFIQLSQKLLLSNHCQRLHNGCITGFQSLGATGAMKVFMKYIYLTYGSINVYCPSIGWKVHETIIQNQQLIIQHYNYPFTNVYKHMFMNDTKPIQFQQNDVVLFHGCAHNPTGIDPTKEQWGKIIKIIKKHELIPFFDYAYQGFVSGDVDVDAFAIQRFERENVKTIFAVQSYSKNMGLYDKRIGCGSVICNTMTEATRIIGDIKENVLKDTYVNGYPPNVEGARIVRKILGHTSNYKAWKHEVSIMHERMQKIRCCLYKKLTGSNDDYSWDFILNQVGMFAFKLWLFDDSCVTVLRDKYHVYITDEGRIAIGCIANEKQVDYLVKAINFILQ